MNRLFAGGLFVMGVATLPVAISPSQTETAPARDYTNDQRLITLRNFFRKFECPAQHYAATFIEAADRYALDWRLLPSISYVESSGGKTARYNNLFGWDSGRARFPSQAAGIHAVGYRLSHSELYRAKSLDGLLITYNPNPDYGQLVKSVMRRIAPTLNVAAVAAQNSKYRTPM